jgi:hypothetical protein
VTDQQQPDWAKALAHAATEFQQGLQQAGRILSAQGAMGWAYRGDLEQLRATLEALPAGQVREISAAAALLASTADQVLTGGPTQ